MQLALTLNGLHSWSSQSSSKDSQRGHRCSECTALLQLNNYFCFHFEWKFILGILLFANIKGGQLAFSTVYKTYSLNLYSKQFKKRKQLMFQLLASLPSCTKKSYSGILSSSFTLEHSNPNCSLIVVVKWVMCVILLAFQTWCSCSYIQNRAKRFRAN